MLTLSISLYAVWSIVAAVSNFDLIMLVAKVMLDKDRVLMQMCSAVKVIVVEVLFLVEKG